jgi:predicted O-methyltransferase YrrM/glycosyltransferase involved in cell wall biosynthesis
MLSTIILSWNRDYLLKQCVESYLNTIGPDFQLIVVDNASSDGSRQYLGSLEGAGSIRTIFLDENIGGEAFNVAIPLAIGDLIHLSENDQIFLAGWREHAVAAFESFDDLGQLSLFSDTPTDLEAWEPKPSHLRFSNGKILYEAHGNVGTSSIIRAHLFREVGIGIENIEHGKFKFPDDGKLSEDIRAAGFWCAWSDRYYVRNVGHEVIEFAEHSEYYRDNYESKPWVGVSGWQRRIEERNKIPRPFRHSLALPARKAAPEKTPHPVDGKPARLWSMFDGFTAECEVLDFLMTLTRLIKPAAVLETGTWLGLSSCAIGRGLMSNGFGHLTTLEINPDAHHTALENIASHRLATWIDAQLVSSLEFVPDRQYDMAIFDSELELREPEFRRFLPYLTKGAVVAFHDTAPHHQVVADGLRALISEGLVFGIDLPTPRGIFIGKTTAPFALSGSIR